MKEKHTRIAMAIRIGALIAVVSLFAACSAGGDSPQDLVQKFFQDVTAGNYSNLSSSLDESARDYDNADTSAYWSGVLNPPYSDIDLDGSGPVTADVDENGTPASYRFEFSGSEGNLFGGSDYKIKKIIDVGVDPEDVIFE